MATQYVDIEHVDVSNATGGSVIAPDGTLTPKVIFNAPKANTGKIYIGYKTTISTTRWFVELEAGECFVLEVSQWACQNRELLDLGDLRALASVNGEDLNVSYETIVTSV